MNWLDILLAIILAASTIAGLVRGFVRTVVGITAVLLALVLALWFYGAAGSIFVEYVSSRSVANFLGFVSVFVLVVLAGALAGRLLAALFKFAGVGWLDRIFGGCFGLLRGLLVSAVLVMILTAFSIHPPPRAVVDSAIAPYVLDAARVMAQLAPKELTDAFHDGYEKIRKTWSEAWQKPIPPKTEH